MNKGINKKINKDINKDVSPTIGVEIDTLLSLNRALLDIIAHTKKLLDRIYLTNKSITKNNSILVAKLDKIDNDNNIIMTKFIEGNSDTKMILSKIYKYITEPDKVTYTNLKVYARIEALEEEVSFLRNKLIINSKINEKLDEKRKNVSDRYKESKYT